MKKLNLTIDKEYSIQNIFTEVYTILWNLDHDNYMPSIQMMYRLFNRDLEEKWEDVRNTTLKLDKDTFYIIEKEISIMLLQNS